jgi:hypothetical protein
MTKKILIDLGIGSPQNRSLTTKSIQQLLLSIRWWPAGSPTFAARPPVNASLSISSGDTPYIVEIVSSQSAETASANNCSFGHQL